MKQIFMACDVCGKVVDELLDLNEHMECPEVKHICRKCADMSNKLLDKYRHMAWRRARKRLRTIRRMNLRKFPITQSKGDLK